MEAAFSFYIFYIILFDTFSTSDILIENVGIIQSTNKLLLHNKVFGVKHVIYKLFCK